MILAHQLTKRFEDFTALRSLSCEIEKGCIYGMVGSNGAGKSTFLRLLTGVYQPDCQAQRAAVRVFSPHSFSNCTFKVWMIRFSSREM